MTLLFEENTRAELRAFAPQALVVLPVGATEQHGPHLPVGTDRFTAEYVARAAAELASAGSPPASSSSAFNDATRSAADCGRSAGSLANICRISEERAGDSLGFLLRGSGTGSRTCRSSTCRPCWPSNGTLPVAI